MAYMEKISTKDLRKQQWAAPQASWKLDPEEQAQETPTLL
jgi:hypothetical protein